MVKSNKKAKTKTKYPEILCTAPFTYSVPNISLTADNNTIRHALAKVAMGIAERNRRIFFEIFDYLLLLSKSLDL